MRSPDPHRRFLAVLFGGMGVLHVAAPSGFDEIVPRALPGRARLYTLASGGAELVVAGLLMSPRTRGWGSAAAVALLLAVFPANVQMSLEPEKYPVPPAALHARLPFQALFIYWLYKRCLSDADA